MAELTPMMKQYFQVKEQYPDTILMFRLGDFYEMFFDDAKLVSKELELVLTGRDCGQEERAPMCGVPFHSADSYIARLVAKGYKVAICEQLEDPALAKGIVKRDVTRVLTPGTVIESSMLDESKNNFLACICALPDAVGLCFADISTGSVSVTQFPLKEAQTKLVNELGRFQPTEIILNSEALRLGHVTEFIKTRLQASCDLPDDAQFDYEAATELVRAHFGAVTLADLSLDAMPAAVSALGAAMVYLQSVQKSELENIRSVEVYGVNSFMRLDVSTLRNLEILETMRSREKRGSLLWVLDKTKTSMGRRLLRTWLERPLLQISAITKRHNAVAELVETPALREDLAEAMTGCQDLERLITRIAYGTANARELKALSATLLRLPQIKALLAGCRSALLQETAGAISPLESLSALIESAIVEEPPFSVREGGMIRTGFHQELDELHAIVENGKGFLADIQQREQERTGIKKLKIGYNRVFGYYIEVSNAFKEMVPEDYIRKQTLTNCERFITQELKELESKVLGAQERIVRLEYEIFDSVRKKAAEHLREIQQTAAAVAAADVLASFAAVAAENHYCCPMMHPGDRMEIRDGRHPVVERMLDQPFVPNDTLLDCGDNRCAIITGPNMAGKSTYMRQVALIALMAQAGSFVPAASADLCIVEGIYTRIGASDDLAAGASTFMVEMNEVAEILRSATRSSLIIFDEIGRGTSTYDGMSIARAVLEFAAEPKRLGAKTLFATHYHELTALETTVPGVKNFNVAVKKRGDDITFLRRIVPGCADGSYGIEVAKLAGVPKSVVERAKVVLRELEAADGSPAAMPAAAVSVEDQLSFGASNAAAIAERLKGLDVNTLTPIESLGILYELVKQAKESD
ncbi:MAG: DNA mismatch repair protein MutS [Clostridia bacterium]|nr:DNA mismatch repair protein MutS [Clostridia bacterium]